MGKSSKNVVIHTDGEGRAIVLASGDADEIDGKILSSLQGLIPCTDPKYKNCVCYLDSRGREHVIYCY